MRKRIPIFYSALLLTGVNLLLRFVSTSFQVYISARIGAHGVGLLQLVLSVGSMALVAGMAGIRTATMYLTAEELGKKRPQNVTWILSGCTGYSLLFSFCACVILYFFAPWIAENWIGQPECTRALRIYGAIVPVYCLCGVMTGYFTAANRIGTLAAVEVAEQVFSMGITMLLLVTWAGSDPGKACSAVILGSGIAAAMTLCSLVILRILENPPAGNRIPVVKRLSGVALPLAVADDMKTGINTVENLMVPKRLAQFPGTEDPLAAFGIVCGMVFPVLMLPAAILFGLAELLIPELARCASAGSRVRIRYLVRRSLRIAFLYGCLVCGGMFLLSDSLCMKLYGNAEAGLWLRRFSLMIPMLYCDAITDAMTKGLGQQKACVRYNIITSAMDVALLFLWLPKYGMAGYYASFLVTHLINFALSLRRLLKCSGSHLSFARPAMAAASLAASVIVTRTMQVHVALPVYLLILLSLFFLFRVLHREDLLWLRGLIGEK